MTTAEMVQDASIAATIVSAAFWGYSAWKNFPRPGRDAQGPLEDYLKKIGRANFVAACFSAAAVLLQAAANYLGQHLS